MALTNQDKLVVGGIGLLMVCNNYSFFLAYWDLWSQIGSESACSGVSFWLGFDAIDCFIETVMVCGMVLGAWLDGSKLVWWGFFVVHLVGGLCYTLAVIKLGASIYSDDGEACAEQNAGASSRSAAVFIAQAVFFVPYCLCMVGMFYQVALNKKDTTDETEKQSSAKLVVGGFGILMNSQNYSYFRLYWDLWSQIGSTPACSGASFWLAFNACVCFYVTAMVFGMVLGAWIDGSRAVWWFFCVAHLVGGLLYTIAVVCLGVALYGSGSEACAELNAGVGERSATVFITQAALYLFYCGCMASLFWEVVVKMKYRAAGSFLPLKA